MSCMFTITSVRSVLFLKHIALQIYFFNVQDDTPIICDFGSAVREGENMGAFTIGYQSMLVGR